MFLAVAKSACLLVHSVRDSTILAASGQHAAGVRYSYLCSRYCTAKARPSSHDADIRKPLLQTGVIGSSAAALQHHDGEQTGAHAYNL